MGNLYTNITKFSFCITHLMSNTTHALFYFIFKHHERLRVHSTCTVSRTKRKGLNQLINHEIKRKKKIQRARRYGHKEKSVS